MSEWLEGQGAQAEPPDVDPRPSPVTCLVALRWWWAHQQHCCCVCSCCRKLSLADSAQALHKMHSRVAPARPPILCSALESGPAAAAGFPECSSDPAEGVMHLDEMWISCSRGRMTATGSPPCRYPPLAAEAAQ